MAFRAMGHEAYSCDIHPCSIFGKPEWHIMDDAIKVAYSGRWDAAIGHPPCQKMTNCGAKHMYPTKGNINPIRLQEAMNAKDFFMKLWNAPIPKIALENPRPLNIVGLPKETQRIQPYMFREPYSKLTYLWLKGFPPLVPTNIITDYTPYMQSGAKGAPLSKARGRARSRTFSGIADAMACQWGSLNSTHPSNGAIATEVK